VPGRPGTLVWRVPLAEWRRVALALLLHADTDGPTCRFPATGADTLAEALRQQAAFEVAAVQPQKKGTLRR
jgi:hypothetical protein